MQRAIFLSGFLLTASAAVWAQSAPAPARAPGEYDRSTQRVERIHVEDSGNKVDELRVGGETKSITVQPKAPVPPYDVRPADVTRPMQPDGRPGSAGQRTWKILSF